MRIFHTSDWHLGKMLGDWEPTIQLRDGLLKTIAYFEEVLSRGGVRR